MFRGFRFSFVFVLFYLLFLLSSPCLVLLLLVLSFSLSSSSHLLLLNSGDHLRFGPTLSSVPELKRLLDKKITKNNVNSTVKRNQKDKGGDGAEAYVPDRAVLETKGEGLVNMNPAN